MDIITQGILGASVAQASSQKKHVRMASIIGLISGLLADADIFIRSSQDPLLTLEYHRHFTHSIFFIPIGALIAFLLLYPFFRKRLTAKILYFYCFMGYLFSGFIDACTSYGTQLLWPLFDERIAWCIIAIVDPIFTITLIITFIIGFKTLNTKYCRIGLMFAGFYLLLGWWQLHRTESAIKNLAAERSHQIERIIVKPTVGNIVLWRSVYLFDQQFYIDAIRTGFKKEIFEGTSVKKFAINQSFPKLNKDSVLYHDIKRFQKFSDDYLGFHPERSNVIGDLRYSMSPAGDIPLWGIEMNLKNPNEHVSYEFYRMADNESREEFIQMLFKPDALREHP
ncbi:MAG: metal-dependent hydrolase [Verrucomicrobiota bacterium]